MYSKPRRLLLASSIALAIAGDSPAFAANTGGSDSAATMVPEYTSPAHSAERSYGERVDDATVTAKVKSTRMGKVTLTGSADTAAAKELAGSLAKKTSGVVAVDNQLTVEASSATAASAKAPAPEAQVVADVWISTNVESTSM